MFHTLLFDLDGTLSESGPGIVSAVRYALVKMGRPVPEADLNAFIGPPLVDSFRKYCGLTQEEAWEAITLYRDYYNRVSIPSTRAYPGIRAMLERARAAGLRLIVATSKPAPIAKKLMDSIALTDLFEDLSGASLDEKLVTKGDVIAQALKRAGVKDLSGVLMTGDRAEDIRGAKENGLASCGVLYGYGSREELAEAGADWLAESVEELEGLLLSGGAAGPALPKLPGLSRNAEGHLLFAGQDTVQLARQYGTPLYLMDEDRFRANIRRVQAALAQSFGPGASLLFASKAASFQQIYRILQEEGCGTDVVSSGEIYTARAAGFDLLRAVFHGNNKTDADLSFALESGVGRIVVDNEDELAALEKICAEKNCRQKILLRITPGIDPHTHEAMSTGRVDSKFGSAVETGEAERMTVQALSCPHLLLEGFHAHVGSQVFDSRVPLLVLQSLLDFSFRMREKTGFMASVLNLGGGFGVPYRALDPCFPLEDVLQELADFLSETCRKEDFPLPFLLFEPGRFLAADTGLTLYQVGSVKRIPGHKNYVSVDGGMSDNPRYALYQAPYTVLPAGNMFAPRTLRCDLVGRLCESGDILQPDIFLPESTRRGDMIAVCTTGAYHFSMASHYNRLPAPPVVMLKDGSSYVAVERESPEDLTRFDR